MSTIRNSAFLLFALGVTVSLRAESIQQDQTSGPVQIAIHLEPKLPTIGDTVTLKIQAIAEQDVEVLMPDFGEALDRFSIVDFAPREKIDDKGRTISTQTYRLDPPGSGRNVIPPILIEYVDRRDGKQAAPKGMDAYEILTDRIVFEVASVLPNSASDELRPPKGELAIVTPSRRSLVPWLLGLGGVLSIIVALLIKMIADARRRGRKRSAYDVAQSRLFQLLEQKRETPQQVDAFYVQLSDIVRRYIEDRFEMRAPDLTTEEFLSSIGQSPDFSIDHQGLLRDFLRQADLVKFARAEPSDVDTQRAIDKAKQFLNETREQSPTIDESLESHESPQSESSLQKSETVHG